MDKLSRKDEKKGLRTKDVVDEKIEEIVIRKPDDFHHHMRDYDILDDLLVHAVDQFGRAVAMDNTNVNTSDALEYQDRILERIPPGRDFQPLMMWYLTDDTTEEMVIEAYESGDIAGMKYYPLGQTVTGVGVSDINKIIPVLQRMAQVGLPMFIHCEEPDVNVDVFDKEATFINESLRPVVEELVPDLRVQMEHISTQTAVDFARSHENVGATITAQHLLYNRNVMVQLGRMRPHYFCIPVYNTENDRRALVDAATSGDPSFWLGSDSAPHPRAEKENAVVGPGCFTAFAALEFYTTSFANAGRLENLEAFTSLNGAQFHGLEPNTSTQVLRQETWTIPLTLPYGDTVVVPMDFGSELEWKVDLGDEPDIVKKYSPSYPFAYRTARPQSKPSK